MTLKVGSICPPHGRVRGPRRGAWGRMDGWESRISSRGGLPMGAACAVLAVVAVVFRDLGAVVGAGERLVRRDEGLFRFRRCVGAFGLPCRTRPFLRGPLLPGQPRFPFPAVACFPAPKGLRLAELGTCGERPPGEACGTLGRGPCSRPFPVCVRLFCYVKITLSRFFF